jgi:hypothetical protein
MMILRHHFMLRQWGITTAMAQGVLCVAYSLFLAWVVRKVPSIEKTARTAFIFLLVHILIARGAMYFVQWYSGVIEWKVGIEVASEGTLSLNINYVQQCGPNYDLSACEA